MDNAVETINHGKYVGAIYHDDDAQNPREGDFDKFGTFAAYHKRYTLGDSDQPCIDEMDHIRGNKDISWLPVFLYDHSGLALSTEPFSGPHAHWDSGQVGFIFISDKDAREWFGWKKITAKRRAHIYEALKDAIVTQNQYVSGQVYGYDIYLADDNDSIDSCWGYYGLDSVREALQEALKEYKEDESQGT